MGMLPRVGKSLPAVPGTPWNFGFRVLLLDSEGNESPAPCLSWSKLQNEGKLIIPYHRTMSWHVEGFH